MEIRKALLSIKAIVIVVLFMGMAMQPAIATSNQNAMRVSLNKQGQIINITQIKP